MTESEFIALAKEAFSNIEQMLDERDFDYSNNDSIMEIELDDGSKIIINRHLPNREIWVAAKSGGFHYTRQGEHWFSQRDGSELFAKLGELLGN